MALRDATQPFQDLLLDGGQRTTSVSPFLDVVRAQMQQRSDDFLRQEDLKEFQRFSNQGATAPVFAPQPVARPDPNAVPAAPVRPSLPVSPTQRIKQTALDGPRLAQADTGVTTDAGPAPLPRMTRQEFFKRLVDRGIPPIGAAGLTGSVEQESQFDPLAQGGGTDPKTGRGRSFGLFQMEGPRLQEFLAFSARNGLNPGDAETQLEFFIEELVTTEKGPRSAIFNAKTVEESVDAANKFFRPGKPKTLNRVSNALKVDLGGSNQPDAAVAPSLGRTPQVPGATAPAGPIQAPRPRPSPNAPVEGPAPAVAPRKPVQAPPLSGPGPSSTAARRAASVPVIWQQALTKFLRSGDRADLSVVPEGSAPVLLALLGAQTRRVR